MADQKSPSLEERLENEQCECAAGPTCVPCLAADELRRLEARVAELESTLAEAQDEAKELGASWDEEREISQGQADFIEELASDLGCEAEWSNLHDHFQCVRMAALTDRNYRHSADCTMDELRAENARLRKALEKSVAFIECHSRRTDFRTAAIAMIATISEVAALAPAKGGEEEASKPTT